MSRHFKIKDAEITAGGPELLVGGVFKNDVKELDNYFELVQELENVPYSKFAVTDKGTRVDAKALALVLSKGGTYYNAFKDLKVVVDSSSIYVELEGINKFYFNNEKVNYPMDFDTKKHFMGYIRSGLIEVVEPIFKCCKQLQEIIKNIIFFLLFISEYDIIFLKIRKIVMNHLD